MKDFQRSAAPTSAGVLLADPSVLTGVVVAGPRPAAALVHAEHPPAPWPRPLRHIAGSDRLPVELHPLQAADEITPRVLHLGGRILSDRSEEQRIVGAHHPARLGQGGGGRALLVQGQPQAGGVDLQLDAVPLTVRERLRSEQQRARGGVSTAEHELQLPISQLEKRKVEVS